MALLPPDAAGVLVGDRYRVVREIGRGGMGVVYEALDEVLDRRVALKFLFTNSTDEQFRERFGHEASVLARLASRHIVAIYDYEAHEDTPYLVTQLVPDGDLHTRLNLSGPLPPAEAIDMALQICEALGDAHAEGVLHRDIKPANVLLHRQRSGVDRAFLCDFGIAASGDGEFTQTGAVVGTTSYLAPERLNGAPASVATDIYSLGCLIWAMLTGRAPYAGTEFQVMDAHVKAPPPQFVGGTPFADALNEFLAQMMAKDPALRLGSVGEASELLAALATDVAGVAPGDLVPSDPEPSASGTSDGATRWVPPPGPQPVGPPSGPRPVGPPSGPRPVAPPSSPPPSGERTTFRPASASASASSSPSIEVLPGDAPVSPRRTPISPAAKVAALVAVLVVIAGGIAVAVSGSDDGTPVSAATDPATDAPTSGQVTSASTDSPTPAGGSESLTEVPELEATPTYRSVTFRAPTGVPDGLVVQRLDDAGEWQAVELPSRKYTPMGNDRVCAEFRYAAEGADSDEEVGEPVEVCGRAQPPRIELIRTSIPCTSDNQQSGCRYFNIRAEGFAPGSSPLVYLYTSGTTLFCPACVPREMVMDDDGRGLHDGPRSSSLGEVQITPSPAYPSVTIEIDGVRRKFSLR